MSDNLKPERITVKPCETCIDPALKIKVELSHNMFEAPLYAYGVIESEDYKVLSTLLLRSVKPKTVSGFIGKIYSSGSKLDESYKERMDKGFLEFVAPLSERALNHIKNLRAQDPKGDVKLFIKIDVISLESATRIAHLHVIEKNWMREIGLNASMEELDKKINGHGSSLVFWSHTREYEAPRQNLWIHSGEGAPTLLSIKKTRIEENIVIPGSTWIHDFAPALGLGRFMIIEIPEFEDSPFPELKKVISELKIAKKLMDEGKDFEALNTMRNIIMNHLLKDFKEDKKEDNETKKGPRILSKEIRKLIEDRAPAENKRRVKDILNGVEETLRTLLYRTIHIFIKLDTGERLRFPLRIDVEYVFMILTSNVKMLADLAKM